MNLRKNALQTLLFQGTFSLFNFLALSLIVRMVDQSSFGLWMLLITALQWIELLDWGIKGSTLISLTQDLTKKNYAHAQIITSTSSILIISHFLLMFILVLFLSPYLPEKYLPLIPLIPLAAGPFLIFKVGLQSVDALYNADQKYGILRGIALPPMIITFIILSLLYWNNQGSLATVTEAYIYPQSFWAIIIAFYTYFGKYNYLRPNFSSFSFEEAKKLILLGKNFLLLQVATLLIFQADNFLVSHIFGPHEVAPYFLAFKYFSIPISIFNMVLLPTWSAFTKAYTQQNIPWIKQTIIKLVKVWAMFGIIIIFMILFAPYFFYYWTGGRITISQNLIILMGCTTLTICWINVFSHFLSGINKIKMTALLDIGAGLLNIPLSIYLAKIWGPTGVMLSTFICILPVAVFTTVQSYFALSLQKEEEVILA